MASADRIRVLLLAALLAVLSTACTKVTSTCSRDRDSTFVAFTPDKLDGETYHSGPWEGPHPFFPPGRTIVFEHGLGRIPWHINFWLAFQPTGTLAPSAGNMAELRTMDSPSPQVDENTISVYNDTCSDFYLFVVASP